MTNHCTILKTFHCDILGERCIREPEYVSYLTPRPNCDTCDIALYPEPIDTDPTYTRLIIIPGKGAFKPLDADED